jgi:hypothetical protein
MMLGTACQAAPQSTFAFGVLDCPGSAFVAADDRAYRNYRDFSRTRVPVNE